MSESTSAPKSRNPFTGARFTRLAQKELREVLRDRRTIVTLVLMPVLVYPLLSMAFQQLLITGPQNAEQVVYRIGVTNPQQADALIMILSNGDALIQQLDKFDAERAKENATANADGKAVVSTDGGTLDAVANPFGSSRNKGIVAPSLQNTRVEIITEEQVVESLSNGTVDVVVKVAERAAAPDPEPSADDGSNRQRLPNYDMEMAYPPNSELSRLVATFVESRINVVKEQWLLLRLANRGDRRPPPLTLRTRTVESVKKDAFSLAALVPLVLIMMTITGAVYPAIDTTAGERERGTLESLMAAPVSRMQLLAAKYVAVVTVAILTALANVAAMFGTLYSTGMGRILLGNTGFSSTTMSLVFLLLILFAAFFAAVLLSLTSFARSFKEAQAYLIPLMLVALCPGFLSLMPDIKLNLALAVTPLANLVLLARDILQGTAELSTSLVAVLTTILYAVGAISLAARVFGGDAILYGASGSWGDVWRRSREERDTPTVDAAALTVAGLFPLYFVAGGITGQMLWLTMAYRLAVLALTTFTLFFVSPILVAKWQRVRLPSGLAVRRSSAVSFIGAALLGISLWPLAHELFLWGRHLGIDPLNPELLQRIERLLAEWRRLSPVGIVLAMAVTPAVCEELFFRGFLISALRNRLSQWTTIVISGVLFGLFHTFVGSTLTLERFLPTTFLGMVMAWVCWRTRSVLPGMLLHCMNNGLVLMMAYYRDELTVQVFGTGTAERLPIVWLAGAAISSAIGVGLVLVGSRSAKVDAVEPNVSPSGVT